MNVCVVCVCVSDLPLAAAHVSVGFVRPFLHLSGCQTDSRGEPTRGNGKPEPSTEKHMLRASVLQPPPPQPHPPTKHTPSWLPSCQAAESHGQTTDRFPHLSLWSVLNTSHTAVTSSYHNLETSAQKQTLLIYHNKYKKQQYFTEQLLRCHV